MRNGNLLIALVVGGVIGFVIGKTTSQGSSSTGADSAPPAVAAAAAAKAPAGNNAAVEGPNTVYKIPLRDSHFKGPADAKVTIVEFSEYQCPFCSRVNPTLAQIEKEYGKQVRIAFKHNPLPFHADAPLASEAALAAGEQGKFWELSEKLFANQKKLKRAQLEGYAEEIGLDMGKFKAALDSNKFKAQVDRDKAEAARFGARGTPTFFINGRKLRGAQPFPSFKRLIDEEIKKADALAKKGVAGKDLYAELTKSGLTKAAAPAPSPGKKPRAAPGAKVQKVADLKGTPFKGAKNAKVTIVEWSDFECPFCGRVNPTIAQILKEYPNEVSIYFKHQPLPFHKNAKPAAVASLAAHRQGKFWEFHDIAFENRKGLNADNFAKWAGELGLNVGKFKKDLADPALAAQVDADSKYGMQVGANGTPTFFINGRELAGAMPFASFKTVIDEEIKKADAMLKSGVKLSDLYGKLMDANIKNAPKAAAAAAAPAAPSKPIKIDVGSSPVKGPANAKVTIIEFSDFQCPFCNRVNPTIDQIMKEYKGKVRVAFKHQPLPFHNNAQIAAEASMAANEQGKFWELHDKMFANHKALTRSDLEGYAAEIGLDMGKFKAALDSNKFAAQVKADQALANKVGASGTPTFFVNGRKLVGAQPFASFKNLIDEELKSANN